MTDVLEAAKEYVNTYKFSVIPVHAAPNGVCTCHLGEECKSPGKHPALKEWTAYHTRRPLESELQLWFGEEDRNIGIVAGAASEGLVIFDIDDKATYRALCAVEPLFEATATVHTGKGYHLYFYVDPDEEGKYPDTQTFVTGPASKPVTHHVRGQGGMVVAPPSQHYTGAMYKWTSPVAPLPLDSETAQKAIKKIGGRAGKRPSSPTNREDDWAARLIREGARDGERDDMTTRLAGHLLRDKLPISTIQAILEIWAERCDQTGRDPWGPREVARKLDSVMRYH